MKACRLSLVVLLVWIAEGAWAQSLWNPGFAGYLTGKTSLQVGDLVSVKIDTNTKLSYTSSDVSSRTITLNFSGGSGGNPLSFLPHGTSGGNASLKGGEELKLTTRLVARVERLDSNGSAFIQGSRTLEINGRQEMVSVSGWLDPSMLSDGGKTIAFNELADSKLVYSSTLVAIKPLLTQSDITKILSQAAPTGGTAAPSGGSSPGGGGASGAGSPAGGGSTSPAPAAAATTAQPSSGYQLTEAKKRELIVEYLNKMLDLIFQKGTP